MALSTFDPSVASRPILVAHRGGNSRRLLRAAIAAGVDWIEVDLWWHFGRIVARHDPAVWRLPLTYGRWRVAVAPLRLITLDELLDAIAGTPIRLLLDLKGRAADLPGALATALQRRDALPRVALCSQEWGPLDAARRLEPALHVFFSLGREEHVPAYLDRLAAGAAPPFTSISHRLLTPDRVAELHRHGVTMIAWTVNQPARARELVSWGVDGITSDSLGLLRSLREQGTGNGEQ